MGPLLTLSSSSVSLPHHYPPFLAFVAPSFSRSASRIEPYRHRSIFCTRVASSSSSSSSSALQDNQYEFHDDGGDLEVRVRLPSQETQIRAADVFVNPEDTSLTISLHSLAGQKFLLEASRLYGCIKPSETVWCVDEEEIVLSLKKVDQEITWPGLLEEWKTLKIGVPKLLKGTSVYIIGKSTVVNWAVAQEIALGLGFVPLQTSRILEEMNQKSLEDLLAAEGNDSVAEAEALVLHELNTHARLVVSTLGGAYGAASRHDKWRYLYAGFSVWLSLSGATDEASALIEARKAKFEGHQAYANSDVVVALSGWSNDDARPAAEGCLRALKYLLESQKDLSAKKSLYVRLGCRGDWPNIMPPGWDPSDGESRTAKALAL